ncbi:MAG: type I DNA topoisomerase [Planctomycetota bacterium]|nr:type I DNA topoisomerase [Planctomycetota bacterium]
MAKADSSSGNKALVIVESPAKARTIEKYLGSGYQVEASIGHIRDLPSGRKEMPENLKQEEWANLGVNVNSDFEPVYVVPPDKKQHVTKLKKLLKESNELFLATDEDREGEAISWHLHEVLKPKVPVKRLVFNEITKTAIQKALENTREIDDGLVKAQETRRILDRLYGFEMSAFLWKKSLGKSAGRVQSVAVRLIVQRERERMAFVTATYWDLIGHFASLKDEGFDAQLVSVDGKKIPSGKDFDSTNGKLKNPDLLLLDEEGAQKLIERVQDATFKVTRLEVKPYSRKPYAPFTTSTLQQEANRKLGFTARRTMSAAQSLYQNGFISYMRTDSTTLSNDAVNATRSLVKTEYGDKFLPDAPRTYASKVKNAQEAHEAIRPAIQNDSFPLPQTVRDRLTSDEFKIFELIWKRTIACQMVNAEGRNIVITLEGDSTVFQVSGKTIDFPGFLRAYVEGSDDPNAELADQEKILPSVEEGEVVKCNGLEGKSHTTQPPARFSEAALTRELEARGIGRPSTYASIIETIQLREYIFKKGSALVPAWSAFAMVRMMEEHFDNLVDYEFTAQMEDSMDAISRREEDYVGYLRHFYFGEESQSTQKLGLKKKLDEKIGEVDARTICTFPLGTPESGDHKEEIAVRVGRYGPYLEQGERKASLPPDLPPDELNLTMAIKMLDDAEVGDEPLGLDPETQKPIFVKSGRFGPYIQLGEVEEDEKGKKIKPKNASLLKGMEPADVNLETAIKLLSLPRNLGEHPEMKEPVEAHNGRYGPYIKCGSETRSLPEDLSPIDVGMQQAIELLKQPKTRGRRAAPKEPLKKFEVSPVTEKEVRILDGRFGEYITDGVTNVTVPKTMTIEEITFERALDMLAEKAAKGPRKKKKKAAKKKTAKKKTAKKKAAKKKTVKKETASPSPADPEPTAAADTGPDTGASEGDKGATGG